MERNRPIPDIEYEVALMQFIHTRGEIRPFLKATGKDMVRFTRTIDHLVAEGFVFAEGRKLSLTGKGVSRLVSLNKELGRKGIYTQVLPDYLARKAQMSIDDVYIPKYMFKRGGGHFSNSYVLGRSGESSGDKESTFKHDK